MRVDRFCELRLALSPMFASFLESIKYVGHMYPVAFIRLFVGYQSLAMAFSRISDHYLEHAHISEKLKLSSGGQDPSFYFELFKTLIQGQWLVMTYLILFIEFLVGCSYILGFGVRLTSLWGMLLSLHMYLYFDFESSAGQIYLFYLHLIFFLLGAGRCLGLDYHFYKSRRGLLW